MDASSSETEGLTSQLHAELLLEEFEEVLRGYKIHPNAFHCITSEEYQDSREILEEFLNYQEGLGFEPKCNPSMEQVFSVQPMDDNPAIEYDNGLTASGNSTAEMRNRYLADFGIEIKDVMEVNMEPVCNLDINPHELDDLFLTSKNAYSPNEKLVRIAEIPHASKDVQLQPRYTHGKQYQHGNFRNLTAPQASRSDEKLSDHTNYNRFSSEDIPTVPDDIKSNNDDISAEADDIPTDTDDISTESADDYSDNEDNHTNLKQASTVKFVTNF